MTPPRLALVSPLPPSASPWAQRAAALVAELHARGALAAVVVDNPYQVTPGIARGVPTFALADLPWLLQSGRVDLPIFLVADDLRHLSQLRYVALCPGVLVLAGPALAGLAAATTVDLTGTPALFLHELAAELRPGATAAELNAALVALSLVTIEDLPEEPVAAAARLLDVGARVHVPARTRLRPSKRDRWPSVEAVVIGYNSKDIIAPCLQTLLDQDYPNLKITVVDNDSKDGTAAHVRATFPTIDVVDSGGNLGFAGGNNLAFQRSNADYFALLNQDAYAQRNWVTELVRVAELDPMTGAVGSKMLFHRCPTLLNSTGIEINEAGWAWDRQVGERDDNPSPLPEAVFGGCGGALLLSGKAVRELDGFDESFFMYFEDTDLAWRMLWRGYRNYYAPLAVVRHDFHGDGGATPGREFRRRFMSERNRLQTLIKNCDWATLRRVWPRIRRHERGRLKWLKRAARDGINPEFLRDVVRGIKRAWRWNLVRLPSLLRRRRRVQSTRRVTADAIRRFVVPGVNEGGHQGDVDRFYDRHSAKPRTSLQMGSTDDGTIGTGWHVVEHPPGCPAPYRWCKGRAWFYLRPDAGHTRVVLHAGSPNEPHQARLFAEDRLLGSIQVGADVGDLPFALPEDLPRGHVLEFRLESEFLRPIDRGMGGDIRELGLIVFGARTE